MTSDLPALQAPCIDLLDLEGAGDIQKRRDFLGGQLPFLGDDPDRTSLRQHPQDIGQQTQRPR